MSLATNVKHGTEGAYVHHYCRCEACTRAANDARRRRRHNPGVRTHNHNGYRNGCRCAVCREAWRIKCADYR